MLETTTVPEGPRGVVFRFVPTEEDAARAARMLEGAYWNDTVDRDRIARAILGSSAWVGAFANGELVATARAVSDGAKHAWIYDVIVAEEWRGAKLGEAVMRLLLDHPAVRDAAFVHLGTRDAQGFYERLGFVDRATIPRPYTSTTMTLIRSLSVCRVPPW